MVFSFLIPSSITSEEPSISNNSLWCSSDTSSAVRQQQKTITSQWHSHCTDVCKEKQHLIIFVPVAPNWAVSLCPCTRSRDWFCTPTLQIPFLGWQPAWLPLLQATGASLCVGKGSGFGGAFTYPSYSVAQACPGVMTTLGLEERFHKPLLRHHENELYKTDIVFVKGGQALVVDINIRYESKLSSLANIAPEKVRKYQHLREQVREVTNANNVETVRFPIGAFGKWYGGNYRLLSHLGLLKTRQEKVAHLLIWNGLIYICRYSTYLCESHVNYYINLIWL